MTERDANKAGALAALEGMAQRFEQPAVATTVFFGWEVSEQIRKVTDEIRDKI